MKVNEKVLRLLEQGNYRYDIASDACWICPDDRVVMIENGKREHGSFRNCVRLDLSQMTGEDPVYEAFRVALRMRPDWVVIRNERNEMVVVYLDQQREEKTEMSRLERLYDLKVDVEKQLKVVEGEQRVMRKKLLIDRIEKWKWLYDELTELSKYYSYIKTEVAINERRPRDVYGFRVLEDGMIHIGFWDTRNIEKRGCGAFEYLAKFKKDELTYLLTENRYSEIVVGIEEMVADWDNVRKGIEDDFILRMEREMQEKIRKQIEEEERLLKDCERVRAMGVRR